eukprot:Amastigsp_a174785_6.p3 type:complete len:178 gc:universal Amastigsp_a174785_6:327-860(+)
MCSRRSPASSARRRRYTRAWRLSWTAFMSCSRGICSRSRALSATCARASSTCASPLRSPRTTAPCGRRSATRRAPRPKSLARWRPPTVVLGSTRGFCSKRVAASSRSSGGSLCSSSSTLLPRACRACVSRTGSLSTLRAGRPKARSVCATSARSRRSTTTRPCSRSSAWASGPCSRS